MTCKRKFNANEIVVTSIGKYPYIVRMGSNNGQKGYLNANVEYLNEGNTISFGQDTATAYYQEKPYFTGDKIKVFKPKNCRFGKTNAQFFLVAIRRAFAQFSWGESSYNAKILENQKILLPTKDNQIDFEFMESFIAELEARHIVELEAYLTVTGLKDYTLSIEEERALLAFKTVQWSDYRMGDLFDKIETAKLPYKAGDLPKEPIGQSILPCLTSSFNNQGLNYYIPKNGATVLKNVISIPSNSDVYRAYYQSREFTVLSDAYAIRWTRDDREITAKEYLFMVMCINKVTDLQIYSYKNKLGGWKVVKNKYIQLPTKDGQIDFEFMDRFISAIQKVAIKDVVLFAEKRIEATKHIISIK